jgi:hypothetical protein
MIGNMNRSVQMMVDTIKENRIKEIITREFSEWKVSIQGNLRDVVEDARNREAALDMEGMEQVVKRIGELIDYSFIRIANNVKEQKINYFNVVEDGNAMIRELVIESLKRISWPS